MAQNETKIPINRYAEKVLRTAAAPFVASDMYITPRPFYVA